MRSESKGISAIRGHLFRITFSSKPLLSPNRTKAISVGSPISFSPLTVASLHSKAVRNNGSCMGSLKSASFASIILPPTYSFLTVIWFWVSVPVLSEQITDTLPSPSTACRLRIMAFSFAILRVPKDNTMVTMELRASGIAATAKATAKSKAFITFSCRHSTLTANSTAQITRITADSFFPN